MDFSKKSRGSMAVIGSAVAIFWPGALTFGYPGVMGLYWQQIFGVSKGAVGNCLFFVLAALGIFMFIVGKLQERIGMRIMITIGSTISGLAVIVAAYSTSIYMIYLWAFLNGIAASFIYTPALTTVQKWFPERRGLVSGIVNFSFGISAAIMSPIFNHLLKSQGYFSMNINIAIITVITGLIAAQFTEVPERIKFTNTEDKNKTGVVDEPTVRSFTVAESIRTKTFWLFWFTWALLGAAGISMVTLSTLFGISKGFSVADAVLILTSFNIMNGLSRIITGYVSDILGRSMTMSIVFFLAGIAYFCLPFANTLVVICILAAVIGFAFGTLFACSAPLASDCFGLRHFGAIFGLMFTAYGFVSGIIGPSLGGYIIDRSNENFSLPFIYLGILCIISSALISLVTPIRKEIKLECGVNTQS